MPQSRITEWPLLCTYPISLHLLSSIFVILKFKCANLKFTVHGSKQASKQAKIHTHAHSQCSNASVGLAQARPKEHKFSPNLFKICILLCQSLCISFHLLSVTLHFHLSRSWKLMMFMLCSALLHITCMINCTSQSLRKVTSTSLRLSYGARKECAV